WQARSRRAASGARTQAVLRFRSRLFPSHPFQHAFHMRDRRLREDAVPEVEDKRPAGKRLQYHINRAVERRPAGDQYQRIEIALHWKAALDLVAGKDPIDHPVETDRVDGGL